MYVLKLNQEVIVDYHDLDIFVKLIPLVANACRLESYVTIEMQSDDGNVYGFIISGYEWQCKSLEEKEEYLKSVKESFLSVKKHNKEETGISLVLH